MEGRDGGGRAATAAARHPIEGPRVGGRAKGRVLGGGAHRELVHVRLAEDHRADRPQPLRDVGVVRRPVALEDARSGRALAPRDRDEVLERDRDAQQRVECLEGRAGLPGARLDPRHPPRRRHRAPLPIDRQPGIEGTILALGHVEVCLGQFARTRVAAAQRAGHLVGRAGGSAPTRRRRPAALSHRARQDRRHDDELAIAAGALASTVSTGSDGRTTSSRRMFSSSIVWAVGAMWSVGTVARIAYWSRM